MEVVEVVCAVVGAIKVGAVAVVGTAVEVVEVVTDMWAVFFGHLFGLVVIHTLITSWN